MPQRESGVVLRSRVANLHLEGVQQRMEQALAIAGHVVQRPGMLCSKSSKGRISNCTAAVEIDLSSGRASASFAASVLSHVFRSGECSRMWRLPHLAIERALVRGDWRFDWGTVLRGDDIKKKNVLFAREDARTYR